MRTNWQTPLDIPAARVGMYEIRHETVEPGAFALVAGEDGRAIFDAPTRFHRLDGPGIAANDFPVEQSRLDLALRPVTWGRTVLLVGLDLGYAATVLARRKKIKRVIVVEPRREIIDLVWPYLLLDEPEARAKIEVVSADLYPWIEARAARAWRFDWVVRDEAHGASIERLFSRVVPFRNAVAAIAEPHRTLVLGEPVMRAGCAAYLADRLVRRAKGDLSLEERRRDANGARVASRETWDAPFWRWVDEHADFQRGALLIQTYVRTVGLPQHEALWQSAIADDAARYAS